MSAAQIEAALNAGLRWLVWRSDDELACRSDLRALAKRQGLALRTWSLDEDTNVYEAFAQAIEQLAASPSARPQLWVWLDYAPPRSIAPILERRLRRLAQVDGGTRCVFVQHFAPSTPCPPERHELSRPSPSKAQLVDQISDRAIDASFGLSPAQGDQIYALREQIAQHCIGLSSWQLDRAIRVGANHHAPDACLSAILDYKAQALNKANLVQACDTRPEQALGGLSGYKHWLGRQKHALALAAREAGLSTPKGALLVGVPGCGKSLAARVTASLLALPLYRLDVGSLFTGVLGGSEAKMRETLALCERLAPCVLWIDEIEKGFGQSTTSSDGGAAQRSLATLITWLQEHACPVFLVATANKIHALPPELTRKGRLDETFFVDLPDAEDRLAVLAVYGVHHWPQDLDTMNQVIEQSSGFSGSELQSCVDQAKLSAHIASRPPQWTDLQAALASTVPLSRARPDEIAALRKWGQTHAKPARGQR